MGKPFISYGNEDVIYELNYAPKLVCGIEIIIFRYILMFKQNNIEKLIAFYKDEKVSADEINDDLNLLLKKSPELYLDSNSLDNRLFIHATHVNKIEEKDLNILDMYLKSFKKSIYNVYVSLDKTCPFAISFSFNYNINKIKEDNNYRYLELTRK